MRISDWSSDVCSSDLVDAPVLRAVAEGHEVMELKWARRRGFQWNKPGIAVIAIRLSLRRNDQPRFFARQRVIPSAIEPTTVEANIGGPICPDGLTLGPAGKRIGYTEIGRAHV